MARNLTSTLDKLAAAGKLDKITRKIDQGGGQAEIELTLIEPDPDQPRRTFDPDKLQSLSDNIKIHGILQPITVQPVNDEGKHLIIMGERRWRAAKLAGLKSIPAFVREATSQLRAIQITENVQRADLTTMEIALAVEQMKKDGMTRPQIAESLGWSESAISRFAGVVKMPEELQELARQNVPVLALSDLNAQWKRDEAATREFVKATPAEAVTRVTVAALRDEIEAGQGPQNTPAAPPRTDLEPGLSALAGEPDAGQDQGSHKSPTGQVAILCQQDGKIGRILTDRKAKTNKAVMVSFGNGERIEEVALSDIVLFEVIEL
ncbi:ParB/RepB/Spo0J family partition protein [Phaeobacter sp. A90a-4k]|uniref:ParB/RepB/Spo0J family partition protein n=1 Tax=unclassified Phaeobacter TaxID=2621772 RepID=UPI003A8A59E3